ncbi:MAG TPA: hypothetical protein PLJ60_12280 [Chryseolinea sp.]|nr:hypothetical protein [Chryseolinea sp.]
MKKRTFLKAISLITFVSISATSIAQDYLVTLKNDTIRGNVKPSFVGYNSKVQVTTTDKKKTSYPLFEIKAFTLKKETYHPMKGPNGYTFMKLLKGGYLSYYAFQLQNQVTFDGFYLGKMDGTGIEVPNLGFKKAMTKYLSDCDSLVIKIDKGDLGKRDMEEIVDYYNNYINSKTVDENKKIVAESDQGKKLTSWNALEEKLKKQADFEGKQNALDMITDIKGKISRGEKVPGFITEGLKSIINPTELKTDLENALKELN